MKTIGGLGMNVASSAAFDISGRTGRAYMTTSSISGLITTLYRVDLASGDADPVGILNLNLVGAIVLRSIAAAGPCAPDFNRDGFLDFFDYDDYVVAFETGDPRADMNCDQFLDFFDYDQFVVEFEAGC